jgi:hypothetical protein
VDPSTLVYTAVATEQTITITGTPNGGDFTLTYDGETTSALGYNASAANIVSALEALTNIGAGGVTGTGGALPGTPVVITWAAKSEVAGGHSLMTATSSLTGGTTPAIAIVKTKCTATGGHIHLIVNGVTSGAIDWDCPASAIVPILEAMSNVGIGGVTCDSAGSLFEDGGLALDWAGQMSGRPATVTATNSQTVPAGAASVAPAITASTAGVIGSLRGFPLDTILLKADGIGLTYMNTGTANKPAWTVLDGALFGF